MRMVCCELVVGNFVETVSVENGCGRKLYRHGSRYCLISFAEEEEVSMAS